MKQYHIGFVKSGDTLVVQARETKDQLSCETWKYQGLREITKAALRQNKRPLLEATNALYRKSFKRVRVE